MTIGFNKPRTSLNYVEYSSEVFYIMEQKERRFDLLKEVILENMMNVVNETTIWGKSISGKVDNIHLYTKYKDYPDVEFHFKWEIDTHRSCIMDGEEDFIGYMDITFNHNDDIATLKFRACNENNTTQKKYFDRLKKYLKSQYFQLLLLDQLGYVLDWLDDLYDESWYEYYTEESILTSEVKLVIEELNRMRSIDSSLTLNNALETSQIYKDFIKKVRPLFKKKYIREIIGGWSARDNMPLRTPDEERIK
jgi:hypothetical protein